MADADLGLWLSDRPALRVDLRFHYAGTAGRWPAAARRTHAFAALHVGRGRPSAVLSADQRLAFPRQYPGDAGHRRCVDCAVAALRAVAAVPAADRRDRY